MSLSEYLRLVDIYKEIEVILYEPSKEEIIYSGNGIDAKDLLVTQGEWFEVLHVFVYDDQVKIYVIYKED